MKSVLRIFLPLVLTFGFAAAISAEEDCTLPGGCGPFYQDPYDSGTGAGAQVYACSAKGSWGGYCVDCVRPMTNPNTMQCGAVRSSAKCNCRSDCSTSGSCTYQP